jgi:hypothetical protein
VENAPLNQPIGSPANAARDFVFLETLQLSMLQEVDNTYFLYDEEFMIYFIIPFKSDNAPLLSDGP